MDVVRIRFLCMCNGTVLVLAAPGLAAAQRLHQLLPANHTLVCRATLPASPTREPASSAQPPTSECNPCNPTIFPCSMLSWGRTAYTSDPRTEQPGTALSSVSPKRTARQAMTPACSQEILGQISLPGSTQMPAESWAAPAFAQTCPTGSKTCSSPSPPRPWRWCWH